MVLRARETTLRVLGYVPTLLIWAVLIGVFLVGQKYHWSLKKFDEVTEEVAEPTEEPLPNDEDDTDYGYSSFDRTRPITHNPAECRIESRIVKFANEEAVRRGGVKTAPVAMQPIDAMLSVNATVNYDPDRIGRVFVRTSGHLCCVEKQLGDAVKTGEVVALVDSQEVGRAKSAWLDARIQLDDKMRIREGLAVGIVPERSVLDAEAAVRMARVGLSGAEQTLRNFGLPITELINATTDQQWTEKLRFLGIPSDIRNKLSVNSTSGLLPIVSPIDGVILERHGRTNELIKADELLFVVGDVRQMQLFLDVTQENAGRVQLGQQVLFSQDGNRDTVTGDVDWISPKVEPGSRTVRVRAKVKNQDGQLRDGAFGSGHIVLRATSQTIAVPLNAIQWEGCSHIVFVHESELSFRPRKLKLGVRSDGFAEVLEGLKIGEVIAVQGSHVLKSDLFKERLGAGEE